MPALVGVLVLVEEVLQPSRQATPTASRHVRRSPGKPSPSRRKARRRAKVVGNAARARSVKAGSRSAQSGNVLLCE